MIIPSRPLDAALLTCLFALSVLQITVVEASAPFFCKCTCFRNSTIIQLGSSPYSTSTPKSTDAALLLDRRWRDPFLGAMAPDPPEASRPELGLRKQRRAAYPEDSNGENEAGTKKGKNKGHKPTCADCNRSECLEYNLPICEGAPEDEVFATCFQRDSRKDEIVVFIFIFATAGLLIWAALRPWVGPWFTAVKERRKYTPLGTDTAENE